MNHAGRRPPTNRRCRLRRHAVTAALLAAVASFAAALAYGAASLPAAAAQSRATPTAAGAASCADCHPEIHARWDASRHSKMVQPATATSVRGAFDRGDLELRGQRYRLRQDDGGYFVSASDYAGRETEYQVLYTLGNRRIQHYLTELPDGRIVVLPPSWDVLRREWFHNMDIVGPEGSIANPVQVWNKTCVGCHVSEETKNYDAASMTYATRWRDFGTSCERCHGPGSEHVDHYRSVDGHWGDRDRHVTKPTRLDSVRNTMICAQCHSFRDVVAEGFVAGGDYYDYFMPLLEYTQESGSDDPVWWPDGKTRRFSTNALGLWQSECFLQGAVACTDCHTDMHAPEIDGNERLRAGNAQMCARCHGGIAADISAHSRHAPDSAGSACVDCHMPRSVFSIKAAIRDHSISIPAPENNVAFGIPDACTLCHTDRHPEWAAQTLATWFPGSTSRAKVIRRATTYTAARAGRPEALAPLLAIAADAAEGPLNRANAIGYLAGFGDRPDAIDALVASLGADHALVRAVGALRLGVLEVPVRGDVQPALVRALADPARAVRAGAAYSLLNLGVATLAGANGVRFEEAKSVLIARAEMYQDDPEQMLQLGRLHLLNRDATRALSAFEITLALDPLHSGANYLAAMSNLLLGDASAALDRLRWIGPQDPFAAPAEALRRRIATEPSKR